MKDRFYVTTPIYYVNAKPHLGTAYSTVVADVLRRYHRFFNKETFLLTGTDEHGQKVQQAAEEKNLSPKAHCDELVEHYKQSWKELNISYDFFFRTTDEFHKKAVQKSLQELFDKGDIYENTYEGWYSVSEEIFYTEKDLIDGKSPAGKEVQKINEKNYFFRMSRFQDQLIQHINAHPQFIRPENRRNEVLGFLKKPLQDLCISRPKSRLSWGIELPFDSEFVTYVWFDALLNYATAVGYAQKDREDDFQKWWSSEQTQVCHLIGKDILTTHAVYWPTMLMALGVRLPDTIFGHGWLLNKDSEKMSKSAGQVVDPLYFKEVVGVDPLRYFLVRDIHLGNDAPISEELLIQRVNTDLANNIGNLLSRTTNLVQKYFGGLCPPEADQSSGAQKLEELAAQLPQKVQSLIENFELSHALAEIFEFLSEANRYLEEQAPWKLAKTDLDQTGKVLRTSLEVLRISATLLEPVMPTKATELLDHFGLKNQTLEDASRWLGLLANQPLKPLEKPLFPRVLSPS